MLREVQAMLQLHLSDLQFYCQLWHVLYHKLEGIYIIYGPTLSSEHFLPEVGSMFYALWISLKREARMKQAPP